MKDLGNKIRNLFCESPIIDNKNLALSDKDSIGSTGKSREQIVRSKYEACDENWDRIKTVKFPNGVKIEWFSDPILKARTGFLVGFHGEMMGFMKGNCPSLTDYPEFLRISVVFIFNEYKGKGYGLALYESALDLFGGIISDDTLTSASFGVWKKLGQKYPLYKYDWNKNYEHVLMPIKWTQLSKETNSTDKPFIMSKNKLI